MRSSLVGALHKVRAQLAAQRRSRFEAMQTSIYCGWGGWLLFGGAGAVAGMLIGPLLQSAHGSAPLVSEPAEKSANRKGAE